MKKRNRQKLLSTLLLCLGVYLQSTNAQRRDYEIKEWQKNKFWWWSSDAPLTKALDDIPDVVNGIKLILDHFKRVEDRIVSELGNKIPRRHDALLRPCMSRDLQDWPRAVNSNYGIRGFPQPDLSCITDFIGVQFLPNEISPYTVDQLYEAVLLRGAAAQANAKSIASRLINEEGNFTRPTYAYNFRYDSTSAKCVLHPVHGGRMDEHWRTSSTIHNIPIEEALTLNRRQLFQEFHRVVDGHLTDNAIMRLPVRPKNGTERVIREDATTLITSTRGDANPSVYRNIPIAENPALLESLEMASILIQQAEDAVSPSNIAILVLPLGLNILPVSFFAEVGTIQMLVYVVLSDVLTVIPLLIKGIELLHIHGKPHRSVVTRMSSSRNSARSEAAAAEIWAADCQARDNIRTVGILFVSLSVVFLVGGTILEIVARSYIERRKRRLFEKASKSSLVSRSVSDETGLLLEPRYDHAGFSRSSMSLPASHSAEHYANEYGLGTSDNSYVSSNGHSWKR